MKTVVISGGGSWGAYTVGRLKKLNKQYDCAITCSTGSLMGGLVLLGEYDRLINAYTSVTTDDIFDVNPFKANGNIKPLNIVKRVLLGKKTIGETNNLRKLIKTYFTEEDYNKIKALKKQFYVTVCNLRRKVKRTEYKSIYDYSYEEFVDYIWASANVPVVSTLVVTKEGTYCDGGTTEGAPLQFAVNLGCKDIDCFLHMAKEGDVVQEDIQNIFHYAVRLIKTFREEIVDDNILLGNAAAKLNGTKIQYYYLPFKFVTGALVFDKEIMESWVNLGLEK